MDTSIAEIIERIRPMVQGLSPQEQQDLIEEIAVLFQEEADDPLARAQAAWFARPPEDRRPYQGKYVAVHAGRVVDQDPDQRALYIRVRRQYGGEPVLIVYADWDVPPVFVFRRLRLEQAKIP